MIFNVTDENKSCIINLIPDALVHFLQYKSTLCLFNADDENNPVSLILAELKDDRFELLWIYTVEKERKKGYGQALVERIILIGAKMGDVLALTLTLPAENSALPFFVKIGFNVPITYDMEFSLPIKQLIRESLWRRKINVSNIIPLAEVPKPMFSAFELAVSGQGNPANLSLPLKNAEYEPALSMAYIKNNHLVGIAIVEKTDDGELHLSGVHVIENGQVAQSLVYACGKKAIELYSPETEIHIIAINDASKRLIEKLLPKTEKRMAYRLTMLISSKRDAN